MVWAHVITNLTVAPSPIWARLMFSPLIFSLSAAGTQTYRLLTPTATHTTRTAIHTPETYYQGISASERSWWPFTDGALVRGALEDPGIQPDPGDPTTTEYSAAIGLALADGTMIPLSRLPLQDRTRGDDPAAETYSGLGTTPDPGTVQYGGIVSATSDGAGGYYIIVPGVRAQVQRYYNLVAHLDSGGALTSTSTLYYEWRRVSAANVSDPYAPGATLRLAWIYPRDLIFPATVHWDTYPSPTFDGELPYIVFREGPNRLWQLGSTFYAYVPGELYKTATDHQPCTALWKCTSADPTDPTNWTLDWVQSPYDLTLNPGDTDYNRNFGAAASLTDPYFSQSGGPTSQVASFGGSVYFTMPTGFRDDAGWLPPVQTVVWQQDSSGVVSASFDLPAPASGCKIAGGSLVEAGGHLYFWTYESTQTGFTAIQHITVYRLNTGTGAWDGAADSDPAIDITVDGRQPRDCQTNPAQSEIHWLMVPFNTRILRWNIAANTWLYSNVPTDQDNHSVGASYFYQI